MNARYLSWATWLWLSAVLSGFFGGLLGRLRADPVFNRYEFLTDCSAAKVISKIDLYAIATNHWSSAEEERAGKFWFLAIFSGWE